MLLRTLSVDVSRARTPVVLNESSLRVAIDPQQGLREQEQRTLSKYLNIRRSGDRWAVSRRSRYAGLVQVGGTSYWLEPPFEPASFVYLLLLRRGARQAADRAYAIASNRRDRSLRGLMRVLAVTMVTEAERLAAGHIAQSYETRIERTGLVRGRPLWHKQDGRPADGKVTCRFMEKSTDTLENRLILAGLAAAARWVGAGPERAVLRTQQHVWRSIADPFVPARHDFDRADLRLNRLTDGYRPALSLARALLFGFDLTTSAPNTPVYAPVFDLADLFETLVQLVAETAAAGTGLEVRAQTSEKRSILTQSGETYRRIRPDLVVSRRGAPVLVVDSKFKSKYATGGPTPAAPHRISREDIFQTFFYAIRIAQRNGLNHPVPAAVAAPLLAGATPPSPDYRQVHWGEDLSDVAARLTLLLIPVDEAVAAVHAGNVSYCRGLFAETDLFQSD
ncbi:hypothetical protein ABZX12_34005 [Kribbella sp. NPDC003505]|uniref:5-methylcytosine restriction system specificity protein McrC n=1 Tax=Kribbella sp. NPDC003505 TaxID=3154448 RepID=UPI0033ACAA75